MTENKENSTYQQNVNPFINRPKFAIVISLTIILAGLITMVGLPLEDYPSITPPQVVVSATYTGASADVVRDTVATPIEAQLNGVEDDSSAETLVNRMCQSEDDHEWECCGISTAGTDYRCKKCYAHKTVPCEYHPLSVTI